GKGAGPAVQDYILVVVDREDSYGKGEEQFPQERQVVAVHVRRRLYDSHRAMEVVREHHACRKSDEDGPVLRLLVENPYAEVGREAEPGEEEQAGKRNLEEDRPGEEDERRE